MFKKSTEIRVARDVDKIVSIKEDLDSVSWGPVIEIAKSLQEEQNEPMQQELGRELLSIAHANMSLITKFGGSEAAATGETIPSGIESYSDNVYLKTPGTKVDQSTSSHAASDTIAEARKSAVDTFEFDFSGGEIADESLKTPSDVRTFSEGENSVFSTSLEDTAEIEPITDEMIAKALEEKQKSCEDEATAKDTVKASEEKPEKKKAKKEKKKRFGRKKNLIIPLAPDSSSDADDDIISALEADQPSKENDKKVEAPIFDATSAPMQVDVVEKDFADRVNASLSAESSSLKDVAENQTGIDDGVDTTGVDEVIATNAHSETHETKEPVGQAQIDTRGSEKAATGQKKDLPELDFAHDFALFKEIYSSRDGGLCLYEDDRGHLVAVDASKLA